MKNQSFIKKTSTHYDKNITNIFELTNQKTRELLQRKHNVNVAKCAIDGELTALRTEVDSLLGQISDKKASYEEIVFFQNKEKEIAEKMLQNEEINKTIQSLTIEYNNVEEELMLQSLAEEVELRSKSEEHEKENGLKQLEMKIVYDGLQQLRLENKMAIEKFNEAKTTLYHLEVIFLKKTEYKEVATREMDTVYKTQKAIEQISLT